MTTTSAPFVPFDSLNEHGTPVTNLRCISCDRDFSVCPAISEDKYEQWPGCMSEDCASYEPTRDADLYLGLGMVEEGGKP